MSFPGGSKSRVNLAGDRIRSGDPSSEDLAVVEEWRAAHRGVLNTFQSILRQRTRWKNIVVAQRHKRKHTIFGKLQRLPRMQLSRMDDVAGCRLIFKSIPELTRFRADFHSARFRHRRRNEIDKYDYINNPKTTGYRGIHDVYEYDVNSTVGRKLKGLLVEIQYRTLVQHAWATAVEVIGFITESQPKFEEGDRRYQEAMALSSEILARAYENCTGPYPDMGNQELVRKFRSKDRELRLLQTLRGLDSVDDTIMAKKNVILIFSPVGELEIVSYRDATEALPALFSLEQQYPEHDVVLVRAASSDDIRLAFKNYFSDAREFVGLMESGCKALVLGGST